MKPIFEVSRFSDNRVKLLIRFSKNSNFWFGDGETATWVPKFEEVENLKEYLIMVNDWNVCKKALNKEPKERT